MTFLFLYKHVRRLHNAGQRQHMNARRARPFSARAQASAVAPVVSTSSSNRTFRPRTPVGSGTWKARCTLRRRALADAILPWLAVERVFTSAKALTRDVSPGRQPPRQFCRLIVAPLPKPETMQRHRHDQIAIGGHPIAAEPARETRHQLEPVCMFQRQDRATALVVIGHDGAGAIKGRFAGQTGGAKILAFQRHRKRQAATGAGRAIQEGDAAPAWRAKPLLAHRRAARHAQRREQQVGQRPRDVFPIPRHWR